jgi:hypothetical protein
MQFQKSLGLLGWCVLYGNYYTLRTTTLSKINASSTILGFGGGLLWMLVVGCIGCPG